MRLEITEPAQKDLAGLDKKTQRRIKAALDRLLSYPQSVDLKKLKGIPDMWRLRVGDWRVILRFDRKQGVLYLLRVRHRGEAYR
ncbi:MAG: type II toxin-antitoxin system RelE/ParE family toxin [Thermoanaerobacteraceae bacterium]|nr:type II toxin-antitoxin system RelE/ParE family toxin [Thermoanaerobacteraceae bacterium]